jgi:hypothetical protein
MQERHQHLIWHVCFVTARIDSQKNSGVGRSMAPIRLHAHCDRPSEAFMANLGGCTQCPPVALLGTRIQGRKGAGNVLSEQCSVGFPCPWGVV